MTASAENGWELSVIRYIAAQPAAVWDAMAKGGDVARRAFEAMMGMRKIDAATIEAAAKGG